MMYSIKEIYKIGNGPSSSHTMGPQKAAELFLKKHPDCKSFHVTLFGSLAATGKGHMTDEPYLTFYKLQEKLRLSGNLRFSFLSTLMEWYSKP